MSSWHSNHWTSSGWIALFSRAPRSQRPNMINAPSGIHAPLKNGLPRLRIYVRSYSAMIQLNRDFKEFLIALNDHSVEYLLVGGYAVARRYSVSCHQPERSQAE